MTRFSHPPVSLISLLLAWWVAPALANDQMNSFRACLQRERDVIYNNAKVCGVGKPVSLDGGTEGEGIATQVSCPAKDFALSQITEKCRKESFIADSTETKTNVIEKPSIPADLQAGQFIDGGSKLEKPSPYAPVIKVQGARPSAKSTSISRADNSSEAEETSSRSRSINRKTSGSAPTSKIYSSSDTSSPSLSQTQAKNDLGNEGLGDRTRDVQNTSEKAQNAGAYAFTRSSANIDVDLATCRQAHSKAQQCCGSPTACLTGQDRANYDQIMTGGSQDEGLADACDRLNRATALSGDLNGKVAAFCTNNQYACQNTCAGLVTKYQNLLDQCGDDCDNYSTYQDAIASLQSQQTSCASLAGRADSLSIQTLSSGQDQGLAAACQQKSGSSSLGSASMPSYGDRGSGSTSDYSSNTQTPGGQVSARAPTAFASSEATAAQLSSGTAAPLAQLSAAGGDLGSGGTYYGQAVPGQPAASVRPIPNGGGAFGAGGATSPNNASVRANLRAPGDSIISTDIDQGFRSGGYSETPGSDGAQPPQLTRGLASIIGSATIPSGYEGIDLKDFLPGGKYYRGDAMNPAAPRSEINPKEVDMFQRISNKMQEKCKLGVLWRCRDE